MIHLPDLDIKLKDAMLGLAERRVFGDISGCSSVGKEEVEAGSKFVGMANRWNVVSV